MSKQMPFTDSKTVENCMEFLDKMEKPACNCNAGVRMCKHTPCIGTVDDIEKLMNAGYSKNLMLDWWVGENSGHRTLDKINGEDSPQKMFRRKLHRENPFMEDVPYLTPAIVGYEGKKAKFVKTGACNLLIDNKCSVHDLNLKPVQGRMACCKIERIYVENGENQDLDERIPVLHTWNTQRGKDLIIRWKKEVNFDGKDTGYAPVPETVPDLLDALMQVLSSHCHLYTEKQEDEEGEIYDDTPPKVVVYTKNY